MTRKRASRSKKFKSSLADRLAVRASHFRESLDEYINDESFDRNLDRSVDFLRAHGFGGSQLEHLFSLNSRRQKFLYIASVTSFTLAVTLFSRGFFGRNLKRVPFLRWG